MNVMLLNLTCSFYERCLHSIMQLCVVSNLERVMHTFITTRLGYCNSLYVGLDQTALRRLQLVQNAAARLLSGKKKSDHITPVLASIPPLASCASQSTLKMYYLFLKPLMDWPLVTLLN